MIKRYLRDQFFGLAKRELTIFLEEHEEELIYEFREQLRKVDEQIPEEESFIDVKMVPLGETILRASLAAVRKFLRRPQRSLCFVWKRASSGFLRRIHGCFLLAI